MSNIEKWQPSPLDRGSSHCIYLNVNGEDISKKITLKTDPERKFLLFYHQKQMYGIRAKNISKLYFETDVQPVFSPLPIIYGTLLTNNNAQIPVINIDTHQTDVLPREQTEGVILSTHIRHYHQIILGGIHVSSIGTFFDITEDVYEAGCFINGDELNDYWKYSYLDPPKVSERFIAGGLLLDESVIYLLDFTNKLTGVEFQEMLLEHRLLQNG